jgi:hypothetical protein
MRKTGYVLVFFSIPFFFLGFSGLLMIFLITNRVIEYSSELPLTDISGIVVNSDEEIFLGLTMYGKIQVYSKHGNFIRNWDVDAKGGNFTMTLQKDDLINVQTAKEDRNILYDYLGNVLSNEEIPNCYNRNRITKRYCNPEKDVCYIVEGLISPKVYRESKSKELVVRQSIFTSLIAGPFRSWTIMVLFAGFGILLIRRGA